MKYILEIKPEYEANGIMILGARDSHLYVTTLEVKDLEELNSDYINEHFGELQDTAYQRGLDDAWEAARKIAEMWETIDNDELLEIFGLTAKIGESTIGTLFKKQTASEAIAKLKAYEEKQKEDEDVKRGDVVRHKINGLTYIVTLANECGYVLLDSDGNFATSCITNSFEKTGKHVDIDKILEGLRYDS